MSCTMVLFIESTLDQWGLDLSKMGPLPCLGTEFHFTIALDYTDVFIGKKKTISSLRSKNNYQFKPQSYCRIPE